MSIPKYTIIVPIYNTQMYIKLCINRLIEQTYSNIEILLIDDGSTDNSLEIVKKYEDNRIKIIHQSNKGTAEARNLGLKLAKGEYISFIDSDDFISKNLYEKVDNIINSSNPDIVMFNAGFYDQETKHVLNDNFFDIRTIKNHDNNFSNHTYKDFNFLFYTGDSVCNKIYKKSFLNKYLLFFEANSNFEDRFFNFKSLILANKISVINERLYMYRVHRVGSKYSLLRKKRNSMIFSIFEEMKKFDNFILNEHNDMLPQYFDYINQELRYFYDKAHFTNKKNFYKKLRDKFIEMQNWQLTESEKEKYNSYNAYKYILRHGFYSYYLKYNLLNIF